MSVQSDRPEVRMRYEATNADPMFLTMCAAKAVKQVWGANARRNKRAEEKLT